MMKSPIPSLWSKLPKKTKMEAHQTKVKIIPNLLGIDMLNIFKCLKRSRIAKNVQTKA